MAREINEIIAELDSLLPEDYSGTIRNDLGELGETLTGATARVSELEAQTAELTEKYTTVAARNYELMVASTKADNPEPEPPAPEPLKITDLFS